LTSDTLIFRAHASSRYSIAALVGSIEFDPELMDLKVLAPLDDYDSILEKAVGATTPILAYSVMSTQLERVAREVRGVRDKYGKRVVLIAGGPHASARPQDLLVMGFDYVVVGEGEQAIRDLLWCLKNDRDPVGVSGLITRDTEEVPVPGSLPRVLLDEFPPFAIKNNILGPVEVTRGCPFRCKFCATPFLTGGVVRHRSEGAIVHWLDLAVKKRGFKRTWFLSPNALCYGGKGRSASPERLESLLKSATSVPGLEEVFFGSFPSEVRPEFVTKGLLLMFREYVANKTIQIGLQSGSDYILGLSNRHHTVEEGLKAIDTSLECGFTPHVDLIFGLPGEREEDVRATLDLCDTLPQRGVKLHGHVFMPLPGSEFQDMPAGTLSTDTRRVLGELSRKKIMTGSWSHQEQLGKTLESDLP
jgi:B12-binding domain/radical SAM domain protein